MATFLDRLRQLHGAKGRRDRIEELTETASFAGMSPNEIRLAKAGAKFKSRFDEQTGVKAAQDELKDLQFNDLRDKILGGSGARIGRQTQQFRAQASTGFGSRAGLAQLPGQQRDVRGEAAKLDAELQDEALSIALSRAKEQLAFTGEGNVSLNQFGRGGFKPTDLGPGGNVAKAREFLSKATSAKAAPRATFQGITRSKQTEQVAAEDQSLRDLNFLQNNLAGISKAAGKGNVGFQNLLKSPNQLSAYLDKDLEDERRRNKAREDRLANGTAINASTFLGF